MSEDSITEYLADCERHNRRFRWLLSIGIVGLVGLMVMAALGVFTSKPAPDKHAQPKGMPYYEHIYSAMYEHEEAYLDLLQHIEMVRDSLAAEAVR